MKNIYIILLAIITFSGCNQNRQQSIFGYEIDLYSIDFEQCLKSEETLLISDIADTVEYILLQTPYNLIITGIRQVGIFNNYLFIRSSRNIYQFLKNGRFIRQIGATGQGPGEYVAASCFFIDTFKNELVVADGVGEKLLFYSMDGVFLRSLVHSIGQFALSDSIIWIARYPAEWERFQAFSINTERDTVAYISNHNYGKGTLNRGGFQYMIASRNFLPFYSYDSNLFFKGYEENDTVWNLSGNQAKPYAYIDMGKYKLPLQYTHWYSTQHYDMYSEDYWNISSISEDDSYFYLFASTWGEMEKNNFLVYDKKGKSGFVVKDGKGIGIPDDILGGPPIKPLFITDSYYIDVVEAYELLERVESGNYSPTSEFRKQLSTINEDTNQLIILCYKKTVNSNEIKNIVPKR